MAENYTATAINRHFELGSYCVNSLCRILMSCHLMPLQSIMRMLGDLRLNGPEGFDFFREEQQRERLFQVPNEVTAFQKLVQIVSAECSYNSKIFYCLIIFGVLCVLSMRHILCD